jgi:starch-binding outer membrane protein, SusD/RagB family
MKKLFIKISWLAWLLILLGGCSKILDVKPTEVLDENDNYLARSSVRHTLFQFPALIREAVLQSIVYSDLRGEFLTVTENANPDLREIDNQDISLANKYVDPKPFYKIIINCNDVLAKFRQAVKNDPSITSGDTVSVLYETVSCRAWAYLQLARIYKEVPFFTVNRKTDNGFAYTMLNRKQIADSMVNDFQFIDNFSLLGYGYAFDNNDALFNRIRFSTYGALLIKGDVYREAGDYILAQNAIYYCMLNQQTLESQQATKFRMIPGSPFQNTAWKDRFVPDILGIGWVATQDVVTLVYFNQNKGEENYLTGLFLPPHLSTSYKGYSYQLKPTTFAVANWNAQIKLLTVSGVQAQVPGDYRGLKASYDTFPGGGNYYVWKYRNQYAQTYIYRGVDLNFMWAEARTLEGYPTDGLNILNPQDINKGQRTPFPQQIGIRKFVSLDSVMKYPDTVFPDTLTGIKKVMLALLDERGLELAYEGKRWFDLVRIAEALNDPAVLADRVARKYTDPAKAAAIRQKLMDPENWYLKFPTNKLPTPADTIQNQ